MIWTLSRILSKDGIKVTGNAITVNTIKMWTELLRILVRKLVFSQHNTKQKYMKVMWENSLLKLDESNNLNQIKRTNGFVRFST